MRSFPERPSTPLLALVLAAALAGCGGSAIKRDTRRLHSRCDVVRGTAVSEEQARCIAKLYGVKDKKRCPVQVDRPHDFGASVYRIRESCNGLGVVVAESSGRVLALVAGDEILYE
jgi:hypothetical protein